MMKNKMLNHFIGVMDNRDEYQQQEIYRELAFSGMLLWSLSMLLMLVSIVVDTIQNTLSIATPALLVINMIYAFYITLRMRKKGLDSTDCASNEEYKEKMKYLRKKCTYVGILMGLTLLVFNQYLFPYLSTGEMDASWANLFSCVIAGLFFGLVMYWYSKSKLQRHF
ncbi:DUF3278 domain-containing protein [Ornithinibacillus sp. JPR2-1]|uniref:DUF3278 domain-containing protein n=1 Tax=Ornithinibacillus sp. JPR2-1 TaxID=2094019 RepID=UPI0031CE69F8